LGRYGPIFRVSLASHPPTLKGYAFKIPLNRGEKEIFLPSRGGERKSKRRRLLGGWGWEIKHWLKMGMGIVTNYGSHTRTYVLIFNKERGRL
jgi:hypothetical protein